MHVRPEESLSDSGAKSTDSQGNIRTILPVDNYDFRCNELSSKFGRALRLMKLTGTYYGNTSLDENWQENLSSYCLRLYCAMVFLGQWALVVQTVTSLFYEGLSDIPTLYMLLILGIWYSQCAVVSTISLVLLPKRQNRPSRFTRFTNNLLTTGTDFSGITMKSVNRMLTLACSYVVFNSVTLVLLDVYGNVSVSNFPPWDGLFQYRLLPLLFGVFGSCSWSIPFVLFCVSSAILTGMFDALEKKVLCNISTTALNIVSLRVEHQKLCELVVLADNVFSPFLLAAVMFDVPEICINFHQVVKASSSSTQQITFVLSVSYWFITVAAKLSIIMKFGVQVNEKVRYSILICRFKSYNYFEALHHT